MLRKIVSAFAAVLLAALALYALPAYAAGATAVVTITAPTQYADGEALPLTDLATYTLTWAPAAGQHGPSGSQTITVTAATQTLSIPVACGSTTFDVLVTTTAAALYPSDPSAEASPVAYATGLVTCAPNPPGLAAK